MATAGLSLQSATVNGSTLTLTYNAALDLAAAPFSSAFKVNVNDSERSITVVAIAGSTVLLTLSEAVSSTDTVTVAYTKPDSEFLIKDREGNEADSFTAQTATNNTAVQRSVPVQPPSSLSVSKHSSGQLSASWEAPASGPAPTATPSSGKRPRSPGTPKPTCPRPT